MENNRRDYNLLWTLAKDYQLDFTTWEDLEEKTFYEKLIIGSIYRLMDSEMVLDYLVYLDGFNDENTFKNLFFMALENYLAPLLEKERPVSKEYRYEYFLATKKYYDHHEARNIVEEVKKSLTLKFFNRVPKVDLAKRKLINALLDLDKSESTSDFIENFNNLIGDFFIISFKDKSKEAPNGKKDLDEFLKDRKKNKNKNDNRLDDYYGLIGSAEFTLEMDLDNRVLKDERILNLNLEDQAIDNKREQIENIFGQSAINEGLNKRLENIICRDHHKNSKILITSGNYGDNVEARYRKTLMDENYQENLASYQDKLFLYDRNIRDLEKSIENSLLNDLEYVKNRSAHGFLVPNRLYRNKFMSDNKIFKKESKEERGSLSLDILLDSSASQKENKDLIAAQAFVITEAFTRLNIPTRVLSFNNIEDYLVLKVFRDYRESKDANKKIFEYLPSGSNRDGLAFRLLAKLMAENTYDNRLVLILTDGKPNDVRQKINNYSAKSASKYEGNYAINDSALELRKLQAQNITTLAVYTGLEDDISIMKKIYGSSFAYIKNIDRFSQIISSYLKNELN